MSLDRKAVFDMQKTSGNTMSDTLIIDSLASNIQTAIPFTAGAQSSDIHILTTRPTGTKGIAWPFGIVRNECIGSSVYFLFFFNSVHLTDTL